MPKRPKSKVTAPRKRRAAPKRAKSATAARRKPGTAAKRAPAGRVTPPRRRAAKPSRPPAPSARGPALFEEAVWTIAKQYAGSFGFAFEPGCESELRKLARASFARVKPAPGPVVSADIRANIETLVTGMIAEARAQGATSLHEWTLSGALAKLCPLYPFC